LRKQENNQHNKACVRTCRELSCLTTRGRHMSLSLKNKILGVTLLTKTSINHSTVMVTVAIWMQLAMQLGFQSHSQIFPFLVEDQGACPTKCYAGPCQMAS